MSQLANTQLRDSDGRRPITIKLARRRYAIGLMWLAAQDPSAIEREARSESKERAANLYVVRTVDDTGQYGLGRKADGLFARSVSAAAVVAQNIRGSFCGIFEVTGHGFWFIAVRDDLITPDGDCFYDNEAQARQRLRDAVDEGGWQRFFAPVSWIEKDTWTETATSQDVTEILLLAKSPRLKTVNPFAGYVIPVSIAAVVAVGAFVGVQQFLSWQNVKAHEKALAMQQAKMALAAQQEKARQIFTPSWPTKPNPGDYIQACLTGIDSIEDSIPGWQLVSANCDAPSPTSLSVTWKWQRMYGEVAWLTSWLTQEHGTDIANSTSLDANGNDAKTTLAQPHLTARGKQTLLSERDAIIAFVSQAQSVGAGLRLGKAHQPPLPDGVKPDDKRRAPFALMSWELTTFPLDGWSAALDRIPGLVVNHIDFDAKQNAYLLKGDLYVQQ